MTPSIYHVKFSSVQQAYGEGLAVFKEGSINGGDQGYLYTGKYTETELQVTAQIKIKRWSNQAVSVFGNLSEFDLNLRGELSKDSAEFAVSGFVIQMPALKILVQGRRLANAS